MHRVILLLFVVSSAFAQKPLVTKIDPPNWWPSMPAPMLLVKGEHLSGASFTISDKEIRVLKTNVSSNGHYAEVWLSASPVRPETVKINARNADGQVSVPYEFAARHAAADGFAGFSSKDVMYLIMTDRFANGDPSNDDAGESGRLVDHAAERMRPRGWHGGDLKGIQQHLDYLQELGVTTVWITPVYRNAGEADSYHGYGATDMYAVDGHFGDLGDLKALADALHERHMKLVLDTVPNHVGPAHPWVADSPEPNWFHGTLARHTVAQGEFAPVTDPHAPWRDQRNVTQGWFANTLPDLNQENPAVSKYLVQNAIWWTEEAGLDGLRIDTFPYVGRPFWHEFHDQLHALYPHLTTVGEVFNSDPTIVSTFAGGITRTGVDTGLDTPFDFPSHFALRDVFLKDAPMTKLADVLRLDNLYPHPERLIPFLGNHDTTRFANDSSATPQVLDLAFTVLMTMRGMPQIYSGDELAVRGGEDPDNRHNFDGGFAPSRSNAFLSTGRDSEQQHTFATVQRLLQLRNRNSALQTGDEQVLHVDHDTFVYVRSLGAQHILVAINKGHGAAKLTVDTTDTVVADINHASQMQGDDRAVSINQGSLLINLAPQAAAIFRLN